MMDLITEPNDPIWRQYVPAAAELDVTDGLVDALDEEAHSPVPNLTHRYPDRVLLLVSAVCASYCRFCTRRRKVGDPEKIPIAQLEPAFRYLEEHAEIRDVSPFGRRPASSSPIADSMSSVVACGPFRISRSYASARASRVTSPSGSRRRCAPSGAIPSACT